MMQTQYFQPSGLYFDGIDSPNNDISWDCNFTPNTLPPNFSSSIPYFTNLFSDDCMNFQVRVSEPDEFPLDFEELDHIMNDHEMMNMSENSEEISEWSFSQATNTSHDSSMDITTVQASVIFPIEDEESDSQRGISQLLMAYGEAVEAKQTVLAEVIAKRLIEKLSPLGGSLERVLFYTFQPLDKESDYLKVESTRNFQEAFKAFYQIFPYGKFAHFAANSAILEAMPGDAEIVHIFDFDIGDGVQWPSMIEAIGQQQRVLRLTSITWRSDRWNFKDTKKRLYDHAKDFGVSLKVDEIEMHDLSSYLKNMKRKGDKSEWFAFNSMINLPHMGRVRSRKDVMDFLKVAKDFLRCNDGVIAFGNGYTWEKVRNSSSFSSFLNESLVHYKCLLESMECSSSLPIDQLKEARTAMECLFVAPFVSCLAWTHEWEEISREGCCDLQLLVDMEGLEVRRESLMEAKEMVREGESLYGVRIGGDQTNNKMVLEWRNTPLVRVSCWTSQNQSKLSKKLYF